MFLIEAAYLLESILVVAFLTHIRTPGTTL